MGGATDLIPEQLRRGAVASPRNAGRILPGLNGRFCAFAVEKIYTRGEHRQHPSGISQRFQ
jgi:hypothetical protein